MPDNVFSDLTASLTAGAKKAETREKDLFSAAKPTVPKGKLTTPPIDLSTIAEPEPEPERDAEPDAEPDGQVDESYHDSMEFPDFSQIPLAEDVTSGKPAEDTEIAAEDTGIAAEDTEIAAEEPEEKLFDLDAEIRAIDGKKTNDLRKHYLKLRAEKVQFEQKVRHLKDKAESAERETERLRQEYLDRQTASPEAKLEEYEPYKEIAAKYSSWRERAVRRIKDGETREKLALDERDLRNAAARIEALPADQYDAARKKLETHVETRYGVQAEKVLGLIDEAAEFELESVKIRETFEAEKTGKANTWVRESYTSKAKKLYDTLIQNYAVSPEDEAKNPFSLQAYVSRLTKDKEQGTRALKIIRDDIELVHKTIAGPPPLEVDPTWSTPERVELQEQHLAEQRKFDVHRERDMPQLVLDGLWARRVVPELIKQINELTSGRAKAPLPSKGVKSAPKKAGDPREDALADLNKAISRLG